MCLVLSLCYEGNGLVCLVLSLCYEFNGDINKSFCCLIIPNYTASAFNFLFLFIFTLFV